MSDRQAREALIRPHDFGERVDPDFPILMRCEMCGKHAFGLRKFMSEAMREHKESVCPARRTKADEPQVTRIFYPRQQ